LFERLSQIITQTTDALRKMSTKFARQLFIFYDGITARNDTKDVDLKKKLSSLRFDSTGRANLQTDVTTYFERIVHIQEEMQEIHRMSNFELVQMCSIELTKSIPALKAGMTTVNLSTISFDEMRRVTLSMCHNAEIYGGHDVNDNSSSNSACCQREIII